MFSHIYGEILLEHANEPRNFGKLDSCDCYAAGKNPVCGDMIEVFINLKDDMISDCLFDGHGCAICMCSSSFCTEIVRLQTKNNALEIIESIHSIFTGKSDDCDTLEQYLKIPSNRYLLQALSNIKNFPMRVKCATLCPNAIKGALTHNISVSTE